MEHDLSDRRFDLILERLDRIADELAKTNERLDNDENFLRIARELATLNESPQEPAPAARHGERSRTGPPPPLPPPSGPPGGPAATPPSARCRARRSWRGRSRRP